MPTEEKKIQLSEAESHNQAHYILVIETYLKSMNMPYLKECLKEMKSRHSMKRSASVLAPNPHTIQQELDVELIKIERLELLVQLGDNYLKLEEASLSLSASKEGEELIKKVFS